MGDRGDERVLQRVPVEDDTAGQALRARRPDVLLTEHLQHARACNSRQHSHDGEGQHERRQDQVVEGLKQTR